MSPAFDPTAAASLLAAAWKRGEQIIELPEAIRPMSLSEGYDVQDALLEDLGEEPAGWKLGIASRNGMRQAKLDRPVAGRVLQAYCVSPGATVVMNNDAPVTVEFEVAFTLSKDVGPGAMPTKLEDIIASTLVTFELLQSRFVDFRAAGLPSFAADNGGFRALIIGDPIDPRDLGALVESASVEVEGQQRAKGRSGDDLIDPYESLSGLLRHAQERGVTLRKGEIVSTGSFTLPFDVVGPRSEVLARFLDRTMRVTVVAATA